jgi:hypothetical protein
MQSGHHCRKSNASLPPDMVARNLKKGGITMSRWSWTQAGSNYPKARKSPSSVMRMG